MKFITISFVLAMMTGCASTYKTDSYEAPVQMLQKNASAYVMMAVDGNYGTIPYPGSGISLSNAARDAVMLHLKQVKRATHVETIKEALSHAEEMGFTYGFEPTILHWEDRATEWSGKLDRIKVRLVVWSVKSGEVISFTVLSAAS